MYAQKHKNILKNKGEKIMNELLIIGMFAMFIVIATIIFVPIAYLIHRMKGGNQKFWEFFLEL